MVTKKNKSITIYMYTYGNNSIYNSEKRFILQSIQIYNTSMNYFSINQSYYNYHFFCRPINDY